MLHALKAMRGEALQPSMRCLGILSRPRVLAVCFAVTVANLTSGNFGRLEAAGAFVPVVGGSVVTSFLGVGINALPAAGGPGDGHVCPANVLVNQDAGFCNAVVALSSLVVNEFGGDPASLASLSYSISNQAFTWPHAFPIGINYVHAEGEQGLSCDFTVTVKDSEAPVFTNCPESLVIPMDPGKNRARANYTMPSVADCSETSVSTSLAPGTELGIGKSMVTVTAEDIVGNRSTCSFSITVVDTQPPVPNVPTLPVVRASCYAKVAPPVATDNYAGKISATTADATEFDRQGQYVITWVFDDGNGNTTSQQQSVIILDTEKPTIYCPASLTIPLTGSTTAIPDMTIGLQMFDNCTPRELLSVTQNPVAGTAVGQGERPIQIIVSDQAGNESTCQTTVVVSPPQQLNAPRLTPAVSCTPTGIASQSYATLGNAPANANLAQTAPWGRQPGEAAVGSVFQIQPGPAWGYYVDAYRMGIPYGIKNVVLEKTTPSIIQCADVLPAITVRQQGTINIRLWWPLLYEVPGTKWTLTILYGTATPVKLKGDTGPSYVHKEEWTWELTSDLIDMQNLLTALHMMPFGLDEVPIISDEVLYVRLKEMLANAQAAYAATDMVTASMYLGDFEMALADACISTSPRWPNPTGPGTGIAQTYENPACCILAANAEYVMRVHGIGLPAKR